MQPELLTQAYVKACEIELLAFKPGNVSIYSAAHDMTAADFRLSAHASAAPLTNPHYTLGEKIYHAVRATRQAVHCNTNLGIILLCAPLLQAAAHCEPGQSLRQALQQVLAGATRQDADWTYRAIRLAMPGGLGQAASQDVNQTPEVTLVQAMALAETRDLIAYQYTHGFIHIFDFALLEYNRAFVSSGDSAWSALLVYCRLLSQYPDSHIERKYERRFTDWVRAEMAALDHELQAASGLQSVLPKLYQLDKTLKDRKINPGTTADLTVATVLVALLKNLLEA